MAFKVAVILSVTLFCVVLCKPLENGDETVPQSAEVRPAHHNLRKRFINPGLSFGYFSEDNLPKMRTKRSAEECEKLQLCKMHANAGHSFLASFQLYFVNKENAKLWDHQTHSVADCEQRFSGCHGSGDAAPAARRAKPYAEFISDDSDDYY